MYFYKITVQPLKAWIKISAYMALNQPYQLPSLHLFLQFISVHMCIGAYQHINQAYSADMPRDDAYWMMRIGRFIGHISQLLGASANTPLYFLSNDIFFKPKTSDFFSFLSFFILFLRERHGMWVGFMSFYSTKPTKNTLV